MNVLIVTGEKSSENYASLLVDALLSIDKNIKLYSLCSNILNKKTVKIGDYRDISTIGVKEAAGIVGKAVKLLSKVKTSMVENNVDMVILMDFPEFNMRMAKFAHKLGIKVVYYISPQVWAWREYRTKALFKYSDLVIPILPFEKTFFNLRGIEKSKVSYFGHPLVDLLHNKLNKDVKTENRILIMPGSRKTEIEHNAEVMLQSAKLLKENLRNFEFVWALPDNISFEYAKQFLEGFDFIKIERDSHSLMQSSYFGILKSGTTTLEAAMLGLPMVVVYRISKTSYSLGKLLIRGVKYISLPNLIAGDKIVEELVGSNITSEQIAVKCLDVCKNKDRYEKLKERLKGIACVLGEYPVTPKIAQKIYSII